MCDPLTETLEPDRTAAPRDVTSLVDELVVALTSARIYRPDHPRVRNSLDSVVKTLEVVLDDASKNSLVIGASGDYLFHGGKPLLGVSLSGVRLIKALGALKSGGIHFGRGATNEEFLSLVYLLGRGARGEGGVEDINVELEQRGCRRIHFLGAYSENGLETDEARPWGGVHEFDLAMDLDQLGESLPMTEVYQGTVEGLQDVAIRASRGNSLDLDTTQGNVDRMLKVLETAPSTLLNACRYESYDAFTFGHSIRVAAHALFFARRLTQDDEVLNRIGMAALLHDVGKCRVPFEILHARGRLEEHEWKEMARHTQYGGEILLECADCDPVVATAAFGHHDPFTRDERGRPKTSVITRITKICDVYEALTAKRPYKDPMSPVRAFRIMLSMDKQFDRGLLRRFIETLGVFPVGSRVLLSDGRSAVVERQTRVLTRPVVDIEDAPYVPSGELLDLSRRRGPDDVRVEQGLPDALIKNL